MKVKNECWCGKRGKKIPHDAGFNLCMKHYKLKLQQEEKDGKKDN